MMRDPIPTRRGLALAQRALLAAVVESADQGAPYRLVRARERQTATALAARRLVTLAPGGHVHPTSAARAALARKQGRPVADRARAPGETAPGPSKGPKRTLRLGAHLDRAAVGVARRRGSTVAATVRDAVRAGLPTLDADAWALDADAPTLDADAWASPRRDDANRDAGPIDDKRVEVIDAGRGADMPPTDRGE